MLKIKLFTHTDLDGVGAVAVLKHYFNTDVAKIDYKKCGYGWIDDAVTDFIKYDCDNYDLVLITDISVNEEVAKELDKLHTQNGNIQLIDHHETALWLNDYEWASVTVKNEQDQLESGTSLLNTYLKETFKQSNPSMISDVNQEAVDEFAETVRLYDTWEWNEKGLPVPQQLNDLVSQLGDTQFIQRFSGNPEVLFTGFEMNLIKRVTRERESYIKAKMNQAIQIRPNISEFIVTYSDTTKYTSEQIESLRKVVTDPDAVMSLTMVTVERYHSEVGNDLAKHYGGIVLMFDYNRGSMSWRTESDDIPVNHFAKLFNGGGHVKAAGSPMSVELFETYMNKFITELKHK